MQSCIDFRFLIGSPKTRSLTDGPTGTAPYLKPQFDEKYASGTLYSCPVNFDPEPSQCSPARPETSPGSNNFNNRDAYGLSLSGGKDEKQIAVSFNFTFCSQMILVFDRELRVPVSFHDDFSITIT